MTSISDGPDPYILRPMINVNSVPRINEEFITEVSEEIEGRVTKTLSQEFSRTESRILGALSKVDEFLLNPEIRTQSGTVPGAFRNINVENQQPNEDHSQYHPHPEEEFSVCQSHHSINSDPDEVPHPLCSIVTTYSYWRDIRKAQKWCKAVPIILIKMSKTWKPTLKTRTKNLKRNIKCRQCQLQNQNRLIHLLLLVQHLLLSLNL